MHMSTMAAALEAPYSFTPAFGAVVGTLVSLAVWLPEALVAEALLADALKPDVTDARLAVDWEVALLRTLDTEDTEEATDADEAADDDDAADDLTDETDATLDVEAADADADDEDDEAARVADTEDGRGVMDFTVLSDSTTSGGV